MQFSFLHQAVHFPEIDLLVVSDLHIGYEAELRSKGAYVPTNEFNLLKKKLAELLNTLSPKTVVLNGDIRHSFGRIEDTEKAQIRELESMLSKDATLVCVAGNHDTLLPWSSSTKIVKSYFQDGVFCIHGDKEQEIPANTHTIVMGHLHPVISLREGKRVETIQCYLVGYEHGMRYIILPSMLSLGGGFDVISRNPSLPFISHIDNFDVYAIEDDVLPFGKLGALR